MTCIIPVLLLLVLALLLVGSLRGHKSRNLFPSGFASFLNQSHGVPQPNTTPATRVLLPPHSPPGDHSGPVQPRLSPTLSPRLSGPSPSVLVHAADQVPNVSQGLPGYLEVLCTQGVFLWPCFSLFSGTQHQPLTAVGYPTTAVGSPPTLIRHPATAAALQVPSNCVPKYSAGSWMVRVFS